MYDNPLISVLMPVFNAEEYLEESIKSVLNQTFRNFELIICYDQSSDNSIKIIRNFQAKDKRLTISYGKGRGLINSLNDGLELSSGNYIARMDADDISLNTRFEDQLNFMEKNPDVGICGTWVEIFGEVDKNLIWKLPVNNQALKPMLLFSVPFAHPSVMIRAELFRKCNLSYNINYNRVEDYKLWVDCAEVTKFSVLPKVLIKYRYLTTSLSKTAEIEYEKRYVALKSVFGEVLQKMQIENSETENRLHYIIGLNERISKEKLNIRFLNQYLMKLSNANKLSKTFDQKELDLYLAKKLFVVLYYKIKNKDFNILTIYFYKFFWVGIVNLLIGKKL